MLCTLCIRHHQLTRYVLSVRSSIGITMHATEEEVDTEIGNDNSEEGKDEIKMAPFTIYHLPFLRATEWHRPSG